ncbi:MAG: hypothetical protein ABIY70_04320 [Capsulimonas sp.]|uniref:hypothetical protein n=1 Tax=Capsulimonas sp. TaxID=2494211 RepID=UPI003263A8CA
MGLKWAGKWILGCIFTVCLAICGAQSLYAATDLFHDLPGKPVAQRVLYRWDGNSPNRFSWGRYQVVITHNDRYDDDSTQLSIVNSQGRVVKEIKTASVEEVGLIEITGRKPSELYVQTAPVVNIRTLRRAYYFTQSPSVHTLMTTIFLFDAVHRLADGRVLYAVNSVAPMEGPWLIDVEMSHGECPGTVVVGELRGRRFVILNRHYRQASMREAQEYQRQLLVSIEDDGIARMAFVIGYYANLYMIGRSAEARAWLRRHLPPESQQDLQQALPTLNEFLRRVPRVAWVYDRRVYQLDDSGKYYFPDR